MTDRLRVGFIGGGTMGGGIIQGLIERGGVAPADIVVCEPLPARRATLSEQYGVQTTDTPATALAAMDAVVLAVKPQDFATAAAAMLPGLASGTLVLSIMAGVRLATVAERLPGARAVRVMPNLGAIVGASYSMWIGGPELTELDRALVRRIVGAVGHQREASDEKYLDMATAVAGSGPGYVTLLIESMIDGAVQIGLPRDVATEMVLQTFLGTVRWAQAAGSHPAALRAQVVSPAGTTADGVFALENGGVRAAIMRAVIAGFERSRALGA